MKKHLSQELPVRRTLFIKTLLDKGYEVHGTIRRSSTFNTSRIDEFISSHKEDGRYNLYYSDSDSSSLGNLINNINPMKFII